MGQVYFQTAPNVERWPGFVEKMKRVLMDFQGWPTEEVRSIIAPTLLLFRQPTVGMQPTTPLVRQHMHT